jgi:hypothetical protein
MLPRAATAAPDIAEFWKMESFVTGKAAAFIKKGCQLVAINYGGTHGGIPTIPAKAGSSSVDSTSRQRDSTGRICHLQTGRFR